MTAEIQSKDAIQCGLRKRYMDMRLRLTSNRGVRG
jgi:hypothetical protein